MLKSFIFLVILPAVLTSEKSLAGRFLEAAKKCQNEHQVEPTEMKDLHKELPNGTDQIQRKYKCYTKCVLDELNYKDEHGNVDFKQIAEAYFTTNMDAQKVILDCVGKYNSELDECEKLFKIMACMELTLERIRNDRDKESN